MPPACQSSTAPARCTCFDAYDPPSYYFFGKQGDFVFRPISRAPHEAQTVILATAQRFDADAVAVIADAYVGKKDSVGPLKDLPSSERDEALVTFMRMRDGNQIWVYELHYERQGKNIKWLEEVAHESGELRMIPTWYEESTPAPINMEDMPWRPMSTLKKELGNGNLDRVVLAFSNETVADLVKPEFVPIARARGGARLKENAKDDVGETWSHS